MPIAPPGNTTRCNPDLHHRRPIRLKGYDYSQAGAYYVTICTQSKRCVLGHVVDDAMRPSAAGRVAADCWEWLARQYPYVEMDEWIVMPNHLHGIIVIGGDEHTGPDNCKRKPLGRLVGAFKTVSTRRMRRMGLARAGRFWQRNYFEHIIRNGVELERIRNYVIENPRHWGTDRENPACRAPPPSRRPGHDEHGPTDE